MLALHGPGGPQPAGGPGDGAAAVAAVEAIDRGQQQLAPLLLLLRQGGEQAVLQLARWLQVLQQHARFLQGFVGLEQAGGQGQGRSQQHGRVLAG